MIAFLSSRARQYWGSIIQSGTYFGGISAPPSSSLEFDKVRRVSNVELERKILRVTRALIARAQPVLPEDMVILFIHGINNNVEM